MQHSAMCLVTYSIITYRTQARGMIVVNLSRMGDRGRGLEEGGHRHPRTLLSALPLLVINAILLQVNQLIP